MSRNLGIIVAGLCTAFGLGSTAHAASAIYIPTSATNRKVFNPRTWASVIAASLLVMLGMPNPSRATTAQIYHDDFDRGTVGSPVNLNGSTPTVDTGGGGGTAGALWVAGTMTTDGTQANDAVNAVAFLPFTPQAGNIYFLSADLKASGGDANWMAMGFSNTDGSTSSWFTNGPTPWMLERGNGVLASGGLQDQYFTPAGGLNGPYNGDIAAYNLYTMVLNTKPTHWTMTFYLGSAATGTLFSGTNPTYTYTTNPTISYISIGDSGTTGAIEHFDLSMQVPEPASLGLLALGGAVLLGKRRRRVA